MSPVKPGNTEPTVTYPAQGIVRWTETEFYPATNSQVSTQAISVILITCTIVIFDYLGMLAYTFYVFPDSEF